MKTISTQPSRPLWHIIAALGFIFAAGSQMAGAAVAQEIGCGSLAQDYGPYDYRTERLGKLLVVEKFHFTPQVEELMKGQSSYLGDDLSFVLRASPNHHRALLAVMRYGEKTKSPQPPHLQYSIDCYFDRAIRFQPNDTLVRLIYAQYLGKTGRAPQAVQQLKIATEQANDNPLAHYNIGLIYFELKKFDEALAQAHTAIQLGYVRPELTDELKGVGKWRDPPATAAPPETPSSAAQ